MITVSEFLIAEVSEATISTSERTNRNQASFSIACLLQTSLLNTRQTALTSSNELTETRLQKTDGEFKSPQKTTQFSEHTKFVCLYLCSIALYPIFNCFWVCPAIPTVITPKTYRNNMHLLCFFSYLFPIKITLFHLPISLNIPKR